MTFNNLLTKFLVGFTALFTVLCLRAEFISRNEYQAVIDTAYHYFEGAATGDQARLAKGFDLEFGHMKMVRMDKDSGEETIRTVALREFANVFKEATKDTWKAKVLSVDIVDDKMAMVKFDFTTSKTHYIDYLVMYKRNDSWRIINKTFVATPISN